MRTPFRSSANATTDTIRHVVIETPQLELRKRRRLIEIGPVNLHHAGLRCFVGAFLLTGEVEGSLIGADLNRKSLCVRQPPERRSEISISRSNFTCLIRS